MKPVEDSAKEMLEMEMPFRINPSTFNVESDDPGVFMTGGHNWSPEMGRQFVLHVGDAAYGFRTSEDNEKQKIENLDDGTVIWWFDDILCKLYERMKGGRLQLVTNRYSFENAKEQELILSLFFKAIQAYDLGVVAGIKQEPKSKGFLTPRAEQQIVSGKFLA